MTHAYNESYLSNAKDRLSSFFDYAINDCKIKPDWITVLFINTGYAEQTQNQNGQVTPMSLSFNPPFAHMPSVRFVTAGSDSYALVTHNGEIVLMLANVRGPFLGLIDR